MTDIQQLLAAGDPLRHDDLTSVDVERLRGRVMAAARSAEPAATLSRRRWVLAAGTGLVGIALALAPAWLSDGGRLHAAVPFEVRVVAASAAEMTLAITDEATGETLAVRQDVSLDNADLAAARVVPTGATFGVEVTFTTAGTAKMRAVTRENVGRRIAVIVDGRVIASPVVRTEVADLGVLSGRYSRSDAERIARAIVPAQR